jgi:hypothetical protein
VNKKRLRPQVYRAYKEGYDSCSRGSEKEKCIAGVVSLFTKMGGLPSGEANPTPQDLETLRGFLEYPIRRSKGKGDDIVIKTVLRYLFGRVIRCGEVTKGYKPLPDVSDVALENAERLIRSIPHKIKRERKSVEECVGVIWAVEPVIKIASPLISRKQAQELRKIKRKAIEQHKCLEEAPAFIEALKDRSPIDSMYPLFSYRAPAINHHGVWDGTLSFKGAEELPYVTDGIVMISKRALGGYLKKIWEEKRVEELTHDIEYEEVLSFWSDMNAQASLKMTPMGVIKIDDGAYGHKWFFKRGQRACMVPAMTTYWAMRRVGGESVWDFDYYVDAEAETSSGYLTGGKMMLTPHNKPSTKVIMVMLSRTTIYLKPIKHLPPIEAMRPLSK